jgi:hypothetical protein
VSFRFHEADPQSGRRRSGPPKSRVEGIFQMAIVRCSIFEPPQDQVERRFLENLALRQLLAVFKLRHPKPRLNLLDRLFWVAASQSWFRWRSRGGTPQMSKEFRDLTSRWLPRIRRGEQAPRIHGELLKSAPHTRKQSGHPLNRWRKAGLETPRPDRLECWSHRILVENAFDICRRTPP